MNKSKKEKQYIQAKEKEAHIDKIEGIVAGMNRPELPDIEAEWDQFEKRIDLPEEKKTIQLSAKARGIAVSVACIVLLAIGLFGYLNLKKINYTTANNKHIIILKDGSEVSMNKNSCIQYNAGYGIINRKITLSGEAYFNVKKGNRLDFIVNTTAARVKVTGTQFNVKTRKGKTEVGVSDGRVEFSSSTIKNSVVILTKGLFSFCIENNLPQQPTAIRFREFPGWMLNRLVYHGSSIKEIIADIEGLYNIKINVSDNQILNLEVTGIITGETPQEALETLVVLTGKKFRFIKNTYEIY